MNATPVSDRIGVASAIRMCRSIFIRVWKRLPGVDVHRAAIRAEEQVLASLAATYPEMGWDSALSDYLIGRVAEHGKRRAAEMRDRHAVADVDLTPLTALATAQLQQWVAGEIARLGLSVRRGEAFSWQELADAIAERGQPRRLPPGNCTAQNSRSGRLQRNPLKENASCCLNHLRPCASWPHGTAHAEARRKLRFFVKVMGMTATAREGDSVYLRAYDDTSTTR